VTAGRARTMDQLRMAGHDGASPRKVNDFTGRPLAGSHAFA
jgi:hypothetical protein